MTTELEAALAWAQQHSISPETKLLADEIKRLRDPKTEAFNLAARLFAQAHIEADAIDAMEDTMPEAQTLAFVEASDAHYNATKASMVAAYKAMRP